MPTTPKFAFRYPAATDPPNGPLQLQQLAQDVEAADTLSYAAYVSSAVQSLPTGATTPLAFGTASVTSSAVSRQSAGSGHVFALNRKGLWMAQCFCRVQGGGSVAYTGLNVATTASNHPTAVAADTTNAIAILSQTVLILAEAGDTVNPAVYHERGSAMSTGSGQVGIRLAWLGLV